MCARGFVFSLDAFVAFVLLMVTVNLLIFTIGTPKPYHAELEAAHMLAHDTLYALATSGDGMSASTYLEQILADEGNKPAIREIMYKVAGGQEGAYRPIIPRGYGYRLEYLNFGAVQADADAAGEAWVPIYDAGTDLCPGSDRCGKKFTKLQASATTFLSLYTIEPAPGESPFCHANCRGYEAPGANGIPTYKSTCNVTPCDAAKSNFLHGENTVRIVRLVVYT